MYIRIYLLLESIKLSKLMYIKNCRKI